MQIVGDIINGLIKIATGFAVIVATLLGGAFHMVAPGPTASLTATTTAATNFPTATTTQTNASKSAASNGLAREGAPQSAPRDGRTEDLASSTFASALSADVLNTQTRAALVNIECTTIAGGTFNPISGSGILIDSRGVILTNAHVAQYFLLRNFYTKNNVQCLIRTGSPAKPTYTADLLYLPPDWIAANAGQITAQQATGDGQNDFAFLRITGTTDGSPLPAQLPRIDLSASDPTIGEQMLLAAYPAGFLSGELIATQLYASSAFAYVTQLLSYVGGSVDLISVGGTIESQSGSSGGAAVRPDGTLAGIIDTETIAASTGQRDLRAITVDYIDRQLVAQGKGGLRGLLSGDLSAKAADFNTNVAPGETTALENVLDKYYNISQ